jgi:hypothetical protein
MGMPPPPKFGGQPVTNVRDTSSPHWRGWLRPESRCLVPARRSRTRPPRKRTSSGSRSTTAGRCSPSPASGPSSGEIAAPSRNRFRARTTSMDS